MKLINIRKYQNAFTLIELMIVIAIIAILATIAIPAYSNYTKKAALSELLNAGSPYKTDIEICVYNQGALTNCNAGSNGVAQNKTESTNEKYLKSVSVSAGVITVSGKGSLDGYSYTLTPTQNSNSLSWAANCSGSDLSIYPSGFCTN